MKEFFDAMSRFNAADKECHDLKAPTWTGPIPLQVQAVLDRRTKAMADAEVALYDAIVRLVRHIVPLVPTWDADYKKKTGQK